MEVLKMERATLLDFLKPVSGDRLMAQRIFEDGKDKFPKRELQMVVGSYIVSKYVTLGAVAYYGANYLMEAFS